MIGVNEDPTGSTVSARADLVLPCLDEAEALPWVLGRLPEGWRAIVVDNGSTDGSADLARSLGATVVHESRRGFGAACHAGLLAATAPYVCFCDCDGSLDPALLPGFVDRIAAGESDLVLGRRRPQSRGAWPAHARAGNLALSRMLRSRTGLRLRDLGPMRAARREAPAGSPPTCTTPRPSTTAAPYGWAAAPAPSTPRSFPTTPSRPRSSAPTSPAGAGR
ncbi:glycosyltransferase family 2 protein [Streptomyces albidoflavus]|uniref:glycosyltransferase family 2 protein n=1 Tax=Streptomyces albidoflavus TaxID=1886 RepID=UPI00211CA609|nr:glycosyltransferase [Streptomyces albidoflavus]